MLRHIAKVDVRETAEYDTTSRRSYGISADFEIRSERTITMTIVPGADHAPSFFSLIRLR
jgi:hypothetical protein